MPRSETEQIREEYDARARKAGEVLSALEAEVVSHLQRAGLGVTTKARVKAFESYYFKRQRSEYRGEPGGPPPAINDLLGLRVVCPFLSDVHRAETVLREHLEVTEVDRKGTNHSYNQFGYASIHLLAMVPRRLLNAADRTSPAACEIQLRTILQDAWAEIEHQLVYKAEFTPFDEPLKRKLAALNANLTLSDLVFQEIRDYQQRLHEELRKRRETFTHKIRHMGDDPTGPGTTGSQERAVRNEDELTVSPSSSAGGETMDDLLVRALSAHNDGQYASATALYTRILDMGSEERVRAIVRIHRGMAWFARGNYEKAVADFSESIRVNPRNAKALYHRGVTLQMLEDYEAACEDLSQALELNPFQFDALYQRAWTYYRLGDQARALADCRDALRIDPDSPEAKELLRLVESGAPD